MGRLHSPTRLSNPRKFLEKFLGVSTLSDTVTLHDTPRITKTREEYLNDSPSKAHRITRRIIVCGKCVLKIKRKQQSIADAGGILGGLTRAKTNKGPQNFFRGPL